MALELLAAVLLGLLALWLVFQPTLGRGGSPRPVELPEPEPPEETRRGIALLAIKEIEFDRETGKLSQADYELLKARYGAEALAALRADPLQPAPAGDKGPEDLIGARREKLRAARAAGLPEPAACPRCGPRPEPGARFCSRCGAALAVPGQTFCAGCGAALPAGSRFCGECGGRVAA